MGEAEEPVGHAFISYVREDSHRVDRLQRTLEAAGVPVWRDTADLWPGEDWKAKIRQAITDDALVFIACFSQASLAREKSYQNEELNLAIEQLRLRRPDHPWLIPVRFDECEIPDLAIGGGRTLASIQRADLFGDRSDEGVARLVASVLQILGHTSGAVSITSAQQVAVRIKDLLPYPERDIRLEDLIMTLVNRCAGDLADRVLFPTSADEIRTNPFRYIVSQANRYFDTVRPVAEALALGCAWGSDRHNQLWRRATEVIAGTAIEMPTGQPVQQVLMELRSYAVIPVIYSAGLGAVHRENWAALRAVSSDARIRDQTRMKVPVIAMANPWMPFASAQVAANILGFEADGTRLSDAEIEGLRTGTKPKRFTPVSDQLHGRLRSLLLPVILNDDDYDETFDELEVIFGVITADEAAQAEQRNQYLHGPWVGAFTWRQRYERPPFEQQVWARRHEAMLDAGFFGADKARADRAFEMFASEAQTARRHRL